MSKRFNQIKEKDIDELHEAENRNIKRKAELDVNLIHSCIASEAALHVNRPQRKEELSSSELSELKTFVEYHFYSSSIIQALKTLIPVYLMCRDVHLELF